MMIVQGPLLTRLSKTVAERVLVTAGGLILSAGFALLLWSATATIYLAALLIALGNGLMWPTFTAVLSKYAGDQLQGAVQGFASSLGAAASIVGLIGGGLLYNFAGSWVFALSAGIIAIAALIAGTSGPEKGSPAPATG
ncbi:MAG: MFS transporter [Roseibium sp.]|nr:MFS transporter [Roseibium sp.]